MITGFYSTSSTSERTIQTAKSEFVWHGAVTDTSIMIVCRLLSQVSARVVYSTDRFFSSPIYGNSSPSNSDFICRISVTGLTANTRYYFKIEVDGNIDAVNTGKFRTMPVGQSNFKIAASSCAGLSSYSNHPVFKSIRNYHADSLMFIHMGDFFYGDIATNDPQLYRNAYRGNMAMENQHSLAGVIPWLYGWDDHDFGPNDSNSTSPSKAAAQQVYREYAPHYPLLSGAATSSDAIGQTFTIGRVRFIMLDTRSHRVVGSTMLGATQLQWLKDTVNAATEPVIGICTGVPWVSIAGSDTWAGYTSERQEIADYIDSVGKRDSWFTVGGDAHMIAIDDGTYSNYETGGTGKGQPSFQFAALDSTPSSKGDAYSEGKYPGTGQFGTLEFEDKGSTIVLIGTGYRYVDKFTAPEVIVRYRHVFNVS